jgi:hypothetical protein
MQDGPIVVRLTARPAVCSSAVPDRDFRSEELTFMPNLRGRRQLCAWALLSLLFAAPFANATTNRREVNVVDLVANSELILRGTVTKVSDGIDSRGIPYTEVTMHISESIRGQVGSEYTFRQFGLLKPRDMGNGMTNLMVTPAGWPTYTQGEETILFLNKKAAWTGLQTTVGLSQGKFRVSMASAVNQANNAGLFKNVVIDPTLLGTKEQRALQTQQGPVNVNAFMSLVKQAVDGQWVQSGRMKHVEK